VSKELAVSFGRMLEQLVVVSRAREDTSVEVEEKVCKGIPQELRGVRAARSLGCCYTAGDLQG